MCVSVWLFEGNPNQSVQSWITSVENHFALPEASTNLADVRNHVSGDVDACVRSLTRHLEGATGRQWIWTWRRYKAALRGIEDQIHRGGISVAGVALKTAAIVGTGIFACVAGPILVTSALGMIGFSSIGVVGGSVAAGIQSTVYGGAVASGSAFAFCQSLAMGGAAATAATVGASGAVGITAATIKEIASRQPSEAWSDGPSFWPSKTLLLEMLELAEDDPENDGEKDW